MKKFTLMMMAGLFALAGSVQAQKKVVFTAEDVNIAKGETAVLTVNMDFETTDVLVGWDCSLYLPDGIAVQTYWDEDEEANFFVVNGKGDDFVNSNAAANAIAGNSTTKSDGGYLFIGIGPKKQAMKATDGVYKGKVMEITLIATEDVSGEGTIKNINLSNDKDQSVELNNIAEVTFGINQTQGIKDIKSVDATAPSYNLQGVRVNAAAKGVIIRDGKKMMVK